MATTTKAKSEREILEEWLEENDRYSFLIFPVHESLAKLRKAKLAIEALDAILKETAEKIRKFGNRFRSMGVGGTATDEEIVGELYNLIH